ncbi:MAG: M14 family zinc carboxypeptidase [Candidatus Thorarchaeota archaeon]
MKETKYYFHNNYEGLIIELETLNESFPTLIDIFSLNAKYNHSLTKGGKEIWCIRITNENTDLNKPEVLFIGGHHGNELVGVENAFWYAYWLLHSYGKDEHCSFLVDNREIYIIPCANPDGRYATPSPTRTNENGADLNRDYDYAPETIRNGSFSEIETRCIRDLSEDHQFIIAIDWHTNFYGIYCPWGIYFREAQPCPDNKAYMEVAGLMSANAGSFGEGSYPIYNAGPLNGSWRDWAYASRTEFGGYFTDDPNGYDAGGQLSFIVEASYYDANLQKNENELGTSLRDGWVSKNIRLALVATDLAMPYIKITSNPPENVEKGKKLNFAWQIYGCLTIDETTLEWSRSTDPDSFAPISGATLAGKSSWFGKDYSMNSPRLVSLGKTYFRVRAKVDAFTNISSGNGINSNIYSRFAKIRNWSHWSENVSSDGNEQLLEGNLYWTSDIIEINVVDGSSYSVSSHF